MARRNKPHDPSAAALAAIERKDREAERQRLEAQGATVTTDRAGTILSAFRSNVFNLLLTQKHITPNQHDAAYTLCQAWAQWKGLDGKPDRPAHQGQGVGGAELVTDRMVRAGREVASVLSQISPPYARALIEAFAVATVEEDRPMHWPGIVERVTGITDRPTQLELVVGAIEQVRAIYQEPGRAAA